MDISRGKYIQDMRVINDPLGQTHSLASSEHGFHFFDLLDFEKCHARKQ